MIRIYLRHIGTKPNKIVQFDKISHIVWHNAVTISKIGKISMKLEKYYHEITCFCILLLTQVIL